MVSQVLIDKVAESQFDSLTESEIADALNVPDASLAYVKTDVSTSDVKEILLSSGEWAAIVLTADNTSAPESLRGACIVVRDTFKETNTIRTSISGIYAKTNAVLSGLLGAGVLSQGTYDALIALTNRRPSWAEHNNIIVNAREVGLARGAVA
ncbi:MAG: hypothetical protein IM607_18815 [Cytophagales bacterium]|nr:hypothetical protein [Cytophagales bacterium]